MDAPQLLLAALLLLFSAALLLLSAPGKRLPPGPPSVPLLGSVVWLTNSPADVEPLLRRLFERHGPVVSLRFGARLFVFVADRRLAHVALVERGAALADRPALASVRLLGDNDNTITRASYGAVWRLLRRNLVAETLHPSRMKLFAPARAWVRSVLVEKLGESGPEAPPRVVETFHYAMFCLLVLMCFGERLEEPAVSAVAAAQREELIYFAKDMSIFAFFPAVTKHLFRGRLDKARALRRRLKELFLPLINARREYKKRGGEPRKETTFEHSYVDTLLDIKLPEDGDRPLTDDEIIHLCSEFLNAGTDTTSTGLQWIMAELVKNPAIQEKLYNEIKTTTGDNKEEISEEDVHNMPYLKAVILEGLRKHPPAHFVLPHMAAEDMELGGYLIPKGATVNFMVAEMGRDEREWKNPMQFSPERFLPGGDGEGVDVTGTKGIRMMPFGVGRRICSGIDIAMLHLEYFVANMVREFEWKEVAGDEVDFAEKSEFTTVMKKPLRPRLVPRRTQSTSTTRSNGERWTKI
ncbi:cytochrome P450 89A2-like [Phragmites australis]|uniref:cytochrome P450 89A2-like n=1 Tax=Phragmites australis TaxID=29695 RepID=UPI002D795DBB|nr:cytochrome P450 89A2-like [Phragmites australis]